MARKFNELGHKLGVIKIDLNRVSPQAIDASKQFIRCNGVEGLPYHYSVWQQEISIYQKIPLEAIIGFIN